VKFKKEESTTCCYPFQQLANKIVQNAIHSFFVIKHAIFMHKELHKGKNALVHVHVVQPPKISIHLVKACKEGTKGLKAHFQNSFLRTTSTNFFHHSLQQHINP